MLRQFVDQCDHGKYVSSINTYSKTNQITFDSYWNNCSRVPYTGVDWQICADLTANRFY